MENQSYTAKQKPEPLENLNSAIQLALGELQSTFSDQKIEALYWNEYYVAIPFEVEVDLPTRGPVGGLDIREKEPIFLLFHRKYFPHKAPSAWSNRRDFPKARLPHLNPTSPGMAPNFCLHRGNLDNWFAEHTILNFIQRIRGWLRDAARDRLIRREDGFESSRVSETIGYCIYEPSLLQEYIYREWRKSGGQAGFAFLSYYLLKSPQKDPLVGKDTYAIRFWMPVEVQMAKDVLEISNLVNELYTEQNQLERRLFGVLCWPSQQKVAKNYFVEFPDVLGDFLIWATSLGIPLTEAMQTYLKEGLQLFGGVPVTLGILRPQRLIGSRSRLELLNFVVVAGNEHWPKEGQWDLNARVRSTGHRKPLTLRQAREVSAQPPELDFGRLLFLGCGALGSKLILHLARSGQGNLTLVDYNELSPHNLVRHGLLPESLGKNKAIALKETIDGIFYADKKIQTEVITGSALDIFLGEQPADFLKQYSWLIDCSASSMIFNILTQADLPDSLRCCRCEIADQGRLGFLSTEGDQRNPRLDDIQIWLFDLAIENPIISRWLRLNYEKRQEEIGSVLEEISIGISCSSETMRLSDEIVSLQASSFAIGFRSFVRETETNPLGRIQICASDERQNPSIIVQSLSIQPMTVFNARNDPSWQVRMLYGLDKKLKVFFTRAKPRETGGILIGMVNFKSKIIYVTRLLPAPPDSKSSPYAFIRGIQDIPGQVLNIQEKTGGMLGYVGEWHTHPSGGPELSKQDKEAVAKIKRYLDIIPLPTHIMVVTSRGLNSHIFSPK